MHKLLRGRCRMPITHLHIKQNAFQTVVPEVGRDFVHVLVRASRQEHEVPAEPVLDA